MLGLSGVPSAGDVLSVVENEARAREVAAYRQSVLDVKRTTSAPANLDTMFSALKEKQAVEFPLVIKGDVQGSVEAIVSAVNKISNEDIKARVLHAGVGGITESDVTLAKASGAPIIGFNVRANAKAREIAARDGVAMQYYDVIYDLTDAVKAAMAGEVGTGDDRDMLSAAPRSARCSRRQARQRPRACSAPRAISASASAASCATTSLYTTRAIATLRRFKDDVAKSAPASNAVRHIRRPYRIKAGDFLETYEVEERERTL